MTAGDTYVAVTDCFDLIHTVPVRNDIKCAVLGFAMKEGNVRTTGISYGHQHEPYNNRTHQRLQ